MEQTSDRPLLFVRCDAGETFGVARSAVEDAGGRVQVWDALEPGSLRPSLDAISGVVVFGSSFNVEHADEQPFIKEVRELTREAVDARVPYLGVCFGAQLLAWSLDGDVVKAPVREVGFEPIRPLDLASGDRLLSHYRTEDRVFQWHMDTYNLPAGAELLATGDEVVNQAYRIGDRTWGVQFHFEIDRAEIEFWLESFESTENLERTWGKSADAVRAEADRYLADHERKGREVFTRFTNLALS